MSNNRALSSGAAGASVCSIGGGPCARRLLVSGVFPFVPPVIEHQSRALCLLKCEAALAAVLLALVHARETLISLALASIRGIP
jgi:hypothetical protein